MTRKRTRFAGLVASAAAIPFLLPTVAGATAGPGYVDSSPDPASYPPLPGECAYGELGWWQWVYDPETVTIPGSAQVLSKSNPYIVIPMNVPAGEVTITEAITFDARLGQLRPFAEGEPGEIAPAGHGAEQWEKLRVEFYKNGELIGASPLHTPDLPDDNPFAWSVSSLGTFDLYDDADTVKLAHASTFMQTDGKQNAFLPKSICITSTPFVPDTDASLTYDCSSAKLTMANNGKGWSEFAYGINDEWKSVWLGPGETLVEDIAVIEDSEVSVELWVDGELVIDQTITIDCVQPQQVTVPPTEPPTEVLPQVEQAPELAFTGGESMRNAAVGAALLAAGAGMLIVSRRREAGEQA